jgi:hypothetical protein
MTHPPGSPRVRPTAYPLLHLARHAIHGHKMIAEHAAEVAARAAAEADARRAVDAATRAAVAQGPNGAHDGAPHPAGG